VPDDHPRLSVPLILSIGSAAQRRSELLALFDRLSTEGQDLVISAARIAQRHDGCFSRKGRNTSATTAED